MLICTGRHVLSVHSGASRAKGVARGPAPATGNGDIMDESEAPIDEKTLKRFIKYVRTHCFPRLAEQSAGKLVDKFVELRDKVRRTSDKKQQSAQQWLEYNQVGVKTHDQQRFNSNDTHPPRMLINTWR